MTASGLDVKTLRDTLVEKRADVERIAASFKVDEKGRFSVSTEQNKDYLAAVAAANEVKGLLDAAESASNIDAYLDAPAGASLAAGSHAANPGGRTEVKSLADVFIESDSFQAARERGFGDRPHVAAGFEGKSIFNLSAGQVQHQTLGSADDRGLYELQKRKTHIRDLFPSSTTKAAVLYGVRETGWVNNAAITYQRRAADETAAPIGNDTIGHGSRDVFGLSPESNITLETVLFPVSEISHWLPAHKNILADEGRLRSFLNTRMVDGVKYAEDYELLHGTGGGEKVTGIFNTTGVQAYTGLSADQYSVQVRRAITKALIAEYEPTGLVVSPTMWEALEIEETDDGHFRLATSVAVGAQKRVWQLDVVQTTAMADAQFLMGAFGMGAQLHDRESVSVTASSEDSDNFRRGVITLRADERLALEVSRPESFVVGTWTVPGSGS